MKKTCFKRGSIKYTVMLFTVLAGIFAGGRMARAALESDNSDAVRSVHVSDAEIEAATLVVGSHLIHIQGLSEAVYAAALDSANEFAQNHIYYKSELADGQWFEISDAASIADITTAGTPSDAATIEALEFTHKTDASGVMTDLRTGETVSVFDIHSPYDLEAMEELEPLKLQYDLLLAKPEDNRTDSDKRYIEMIRKLFAEDVHTQDCMTLDDYLEALGRYKADLNERASAAWVEMADELMESTDASRRVFVFYQLDELLNEFLNRAQGLAGSADDGNSGSNGNAGAGTGNGDGTDADGGENSGGAGTGTGGNDGESGAGDEDSEEEEPQADTSLVVNNDIVSAAGDCINNVQSSLSSCEAKLLTEGTTVISRHRYDTAGDLTAYAVVNDYGSCDTLMAQLVAMKNIIEEKVVDVETELSLLDTVLIVQTRENYENAIKAGASSDYVSLIAGGSPAAAGERYLTGQKAQAEVLRGDYQTMLDARWKRVKNEDAVSDALRCLDGIAGMNSLVQEDDAKRYLLESVEAHRLWLQESYAALLSQAGASSEMDRLSEEKERLQAQYQDALDRNNLSAAALLEAQLAAVAADIDALEQDYLSILNSPNSSESDKAKAAAGLGDGTAASAIDNLKNSFLDALGNTGEGTDLSQLAGELSNVLAAMRELSKLNPQAAAGALDGISDALEKGSALSDADEAALLGTVGELQAEAENALGNANAATMSASALKELLDAAMRGLFGTDYADATALQKAQALLAVEWFGEEAKNQKILAQAGVMAQEQQAAGSPYLYKKYTGESGDYLSLRAVGAILGYRTIFDNVHVVETLSSGRGYYTFTNGRKAYESGGQTKMLENPPLLQERQLYLADTDGRALFELYEEQIDAAAYAVAYTEDMKTGAQEVLASLREGA